MQMPLHHLLFPEVSEAASLERISDTLSEIGTDMRRKRCDDDLTKSKQDKLMERVEDLE